MSGFGQGFGRGASMFGNSGGSGRPPQPQPASSSSPFATIGSSSNNTAPSQNLNATNTNSQLGGGGGSSMGGSDGNFRSGFGSSSNVAMAGGGGASSGGGGGNFASSFGYSASSGNVNAMAPTLEFGVSSNSINHSLPAPQSSSALASSFSTNAFASNSMTPFENIGTSNNNASLAIPPSNPSPFASSPNVAISNNNNINNNNTSQFGSLGGGNNGMDQATTTSSTPFGASNTSTPFGQQGGGGGGNMNHQKPPNPFGVSNNVKISTTENPTTTTAFGQSSNHVMMNSGNHSMMDGVGSQEHHNGMQGSDDAWGTFQDGNQGQQQQQHEDQVFIPQSNSSAKASNDTATADMEADKLEKRKAKLEHNIKVAKMKVLAMQSKSRDMNPGAAPYVPGPTSTSMPPTATSTRRETATSFGKEKQYKKTKNASQGHPNTNPNNTPSLSSSTPSTSLADRNALRFAPTLTQTHSLLPRDLKPDQTTQTGSNSVHNHKTNAADAATTDHNLGQNPTAQRSKAPTTFAPTPPPITTKNAVSLVGTCLHMCPDEELVRREDEGDLQLLELPHTKDGGEEALHPKGWTLRNTAVKRFRRSAADFRLDIPELIRPPFVLEMVCGYLEEWVMERDRQGPDPRFEGNGGNRTPPPLDVYQFIWDRTRMVRKDFILQNYTGTAGGKCSAVAVRCHERIARWHAMCEHQLSHIPEFVKMQSQQNIQELGQTLKSLNYYYDDAERRATLEEEEGGDNSTMIHGCRNSYVMGKPPVDYDGKTLDNRDDDDENNTRRIIGCRIHAAGTAEPEMRGLYILLTLNIDGGMEVLKYAGRLSVERPNVFSSKPVQLALEVYKVKKEHNYARFFSILRSPSTPYLFACVMFKYVEQMRKVAFRIMNKTYGARRRDTGEGLNDSYPLVNLVNLLCFEDSEEAMNACRHYNIRVEMISASPPSAEGEGAMIGTDHTNGAVDMILWKASEFKELVCPKRKVPLPLGPLKMKRTIEAKVNGVTRLGVCRGQISGLGATLKTKRVLQRSNSSAIREKEEIKARNQLRIRIEKKREQREIEKNDEKIRLLKIKMEEIAAKEAANEARIKKAADEERIRSVIAMKVAEVNKRQELAAVKVAEKRVAEEGKKRALVEENKRLALAALRAAEKRIKEELAAKKLVEEEGKEFAAQQKEVERKELERQKKERERQRIEVEKSRLQKERENKEEMKRKAKEDVERRIEFEWQTKIDFARKIFVMKKWQILVSEKKYRRESTQNSLEDFDPIGQKLSFPFSDILQRKIQTANASVKKQIPAGLAINYSCTSEDLFYRLGTDSSRFIDLSNMLLSTLCNKNNISSLSVHTVVLFKLAVVIVKKKATRDNVPKLVQMWINSRLKLDVVLRKKLEGKEVRTVVVFRDLDSVKYDGFDAILFVIPSNNATDVQIQVKNSDLSSHIGHRVPYLVLRLDDGEAKLLTHFGTVDINNTCEPNEGFDHLEEGDYDNYLVAGCESLIQDYANNLCDKTHIFPCSTIERVSVQKLCCLVMRRTLWEISENTEGLPSHLLREAFNRSEENVIGHCRDALIALLQEISLLSDCDKYGSLSYWPGSEFLDPSSSEVPSYFAGNKGLPKNWRQSLNPTKLKDIVWDMFPSFVHPTPAIAVVGEMLAGAPLLVRQRCGNMFEEKQIQSCFESVFQWQESIAENNGVVIAIYLPQGEVASLIDRTIDGLIQETLTRTTTHIPDALLLLPLALLEGKSSSGLDKIDYSREDISNLELQEGHTKGKSTDKLFILPSTAFSSLEENRRSKRSIPICRGKCSPKKNDLDVFDVKRQKINDEEDYNCLTELDESKLYTAKLQALLDGDMTIDVGIGETTLVDILSYGCDDIRSK